MWGLESSIVDTRVTRKSYGFVFSDVWDANRHDPYLDRYYFDELDGVKRASHQMAWVLRKVCCDSAPQSPAFRLFTDRLVSRAVE